MFTAWEYFSLIAASLIFHFHSFHIIYTLKGRFTIRPSWWNGSVLLNPPWKISFFHLGNIYLRTWFLIILTSYRLSSYQEKIDHVCLINLKKILSFNLINLAIFFFLSSTRWSSNKYSNVMTKKMLFWLVKIKNVVVNSYIFFDAFDVFKNHDCVNV